MAEIVKILVDNSFLDDFYPTIFTLDRLSKEKLQEQEMVGSYLYCETLNQLYQPILQYCVDERSCSINNDVSSSNDVFSSIADESDTMAFMQAKGSDSSVRFHIQIGSPPVSSAMVEKLNSISIPVFRTENEENESLDMSSDSYPAISKEQSSATKFGNVIGKNVEGGIDGGMQLKEGDTGAHHELTEFQKNDFMMERNYELQGNELPVEGGNDVQLHTSGGDNLTYNFKLWGQGHSVNVRLGYHDDESRLDFEPSEGLAEARLTEMWERTDLPQNWYLQDDKEGKQQRPDQPEPEEDDIHDW